MPFLHRGEARLYFEDSGSGFPILLLAAGSHRSRIDSWPRLATTYPDFRFDPLVEFPAYFRLIAMDQRNAGLSVGPVESDDGWDMFAADQIAVMDHVGIEKFHILGGCIGGPFALALCEKVPDRVASVVLQDPIGADPAAPKANLEHYREWAADIAAERPDLDPGKLEAFGRNLYERDFAFSVTREFVASCQTPMLIMPSDDHHHPLVVAEEVAALAPFAEIDRTWRERSPARNAQRVREFFEAHTP